MTTRAEVLELASEAEPILPSVAVVLREYANLLNGGNIVDRPEDGEGIVREPVAYVVQSLPDGSIGNRIAVTAWTTFPAEREKLEQDTWVKAGCAKLAPLYSEARIAQDAQEIAALKAELRNIAEADYRKWDEGMRDPQSFVDWAKSRARHALAAHPKESP